MLPIPTSLTKATDGRASQLALDLIQTGWKRLEAGDIPAAMSRFQRAAKVAPGSAAPQMALAHGALRFGLLEAALAYAQGVLEAEEGHTEAHTLSARALFGLGRDAAATEHLDNALRSMPEDGQALYLMAHHGIRGDVDQLGRLLADREPSDPEARMLGMALANAQALAGSAELSLATAAIAHRTEHVAESAIAEELRMQSELLRVLTSLPWGQGGGCRVSQPIFVVGLPHSGAMLAERALTAGGEILPAGPVRALIHLVSKLPRCIGAPYPRAAAVLDPHTATVLANRYRDYAEVGSAVRWVDRCPDGARYLPLALRLFPMAKVLHVTRNVESAAHAAALSLFDGDDAPYARDPASFTEQHAFEKRLVDLVEASLPVEVHRMRYEDLVQDPGGAIAEFRDVG